MALLLALAIFVVVAIAVSWVVDQAARKTRLAAQAAAVVRDYVAGMTDRYATEEYMRLTDPTVPA